MDPFEHLPVELVLSILHHTGDFLGVDSLLQVSPCVHDVFQSNSLQLTKDLVASCPTTAYNLHHLFYTCALIHSPSFNSAKLEDLDTASSDINLNNDTARLMVSIAAEIQKLACACLSMAWDNFQTAHRAILPEEWQHGCEQFSWIEEFRVHRSLWKLWIFSDLWNIVQAEKKAPVPDHPPPTCTVTSKRWILPTPKIVEIRSLAILNLPALQSYELHSVADLVRHLGASSLQDAETPTVGGSKTVVPPPPPLPLFASLHVPNISDEHATWASPPIPKETPQDFHWGQSPEYTYGGSCQAIFYIAMQRNLSYPPGLYPTGLDDMRPFYRLGVFIWDSWRMCQMGFLNKAHAWEGEMIQTPDGSYVHVPFVGMQLLQKRWCALVGRKPGGSKSIQDVMEGLKLF